MQKRKHSATTAAKIGSPSQLSAIQSNSLNHDWESSADTHTRSVALTEAGERLLQTIGPRFDEIDEELQ
ncbi:hypothetical protein WJT86_05380 [Microvirga sp. W0021]|uniref:Transcriptional regulator n=1 Tax=Hohaiivirga grylli TaxID=3133970 RepID=A0ABV0BJP6_9HYPH